MYFSRIFLLLGLLLNSISNVFAQSLKEELAGTTNFIEAQIKASNYFEQKPGTPSGIVDNEFIKYKRFEWHWQNRVNEDGSLPDLNEQYAVYKSLQKKESNQKTAAAGTWRNISQTTSSGGYSAMGRVISMAFHPTDSNIMYVGGAIGGIWKTTVGGNNWQPLGDELPYSSVGNIVVNPSNPSTIYITIGEKDGWWKYGLGIYKSNDEGITWQPTSQVSNFNQAIVYYKLLMSPTDTNVLYSAQSNGFFKSTDAGNTWSSIFAGEFVDFQFKPFNENTLYLAKKNNSSNIFKSTDAGATWTQISNLSIPISNIRIAVTPADSNYIGLGTDGGGLKYFFLSDDGGLNFTLNNNSIDDPAVLHFSRNDKQKVYCGYVSNHRSTDAGLTWTQITNWYNDGVLPEVHADNHFAAFNPLQPNYIYYCNDGGLYRFNETTNKWKDLSNGLIITQFYKIANSSQDSLFMIGGTQDNGGRKRLNATEWGATNGGDGMEVAIDKLNDNTIYTTYWGGTMYRSYDKWDLDQYNEITPDPTVKGAWVTPYLLDYSNNNRIVAGYKKVWVSDDQGSIWTEISSDLGSENLEVLDIAKSNSQVIYTGYGNRMFYTFNFGQNWTTRTLPGSTTQFERVSQLLVHPKNENLVYLTKSGYNANNKVFLFNKTSNSFTNLKYNLPNTPVNCITIDLESDTLNYDLYIGTDVGVFHKKEQDTIWQYYGTGMPNTQVSDLEIYYPTGKIRAATYGRGIFENDIVRTVFPLEINENSVTTNQVNISNNPFAENITLNIVSENTETLFIKILNQSGQVVKRITTESNGNKIHLSIPMNEFAKGMYFIDIRNAKNWHYTQKIQKN